MAVLYLHAVIAPASDVSTLPEHLYTRGFLGGRHSDITIIAFGQRYPLHRLILDRAPFFMNGLSEPWVESSQREVPLHPEELDSNITKTAFELALKKLYGVDISPDEDTEAIGLFATGCWLEMQDLIDVAIESIMRQMAPDNLASLIKLVTTNYYGKAGERILASARAMLCRDGSEMPLKYWENIPAEVVKDIIGDDGFYIAGEWERWYLARRLLDRRLKHKAVEVGILAQYSKSRPQAPSDIWFQAIRSDSAYRRDFVQGSLEVPEKVHKWCLLYTHPEIEPVLELLQEGIHYAHLEFEQLMFIRQSRDMFGQPVVPDALITEAQWQQLELRSKVLGARDTELELGLSFPLEQTADALEENQIIHASPVRRTASAKGKGKAADGEAESISLMSTATPRLIGSTTVQSKQADNNEDKKKFYIPSQDCNIVIGGNSDPVVTASSTVQRSAPGDANEPVPDLSTSPPLSDRPVTPGATVTSGSQPRPERYSTFPPFRFAAEFPNPRLLKEKKRVYSRTIFYAGSLWNVYIQKVRSTKNPQLGVYLHRAKEREVEEGVISGVGAAGHASYLMSGGNVVGSYGGRTDTIDEQIGRLEREMLLRGERREHHRALRTARHRSAQSQPIDLIATRANGADDTSGSGDETQPIPTAATSSSARLASYGRQRARRNKSSEDTIHASLQQRWAFPQGNASSPSSSGTDDDATADEDDMFNAFSTIPTRSLSQPLASANSTSPTDRRPRKLIVRSSTGHTATPGPAAIARDQREREAQAGRPGISRMPTLPPYVDARPTIRTWFKIYSPSRGGRLLSVYESAPDQFNFSQSWGWKSGSLMLDEGFGASGAAAGSLGSAVELGMGGDGEGLDRKETEGLDRKASLAGGKKRWKPKGEGKLRFMVVIGNL